MSRARFIAGATCSVCGSLDRIVVEESPRGLVKRCVACGDEATLATEAPSEPESAPSDHRIIVRSSATDDVG